MYMYVCGWFNEVVHKTYTTYISDVLFYIYTRHFFDFDN